MAGNKKNRRRISLVPATSHDEMVSMFQSSIQQVFDNFSNYSWSVECNFGV